MLLAIDIGNTNTSLGLFKGKELISRYDIPTNKNGYCSDLRRIINGKAIDDAIICSVVPQATLVLAKDLKKLLGNNALVIGRDIIVPIKNLYSKPRQVGCDRLVNAYAGVRLYKAPLIVVDFGTAITFDVVSKDKEYLGGLILPGLEISLDILAQRTALLPKVKLGRPCGLIGRDTKNSMLSGIIYGFTALTDCLVKQIKHKIGRYSGVIGTGGNINLMRGYCKQFNHIDRDLTLKGLSLIYQQKNQQKNP